MRKSPIHRIADRRHQEHTAGAKTTNVLRRQGMSRETFYKCRRKYSGLKVDEAKWLRALDDENS